MKFCQPTPDELLEIQGVGRLLAAVRTDVILRLPHAPIDVLIEPSMDAKLCYQLATGIYEQDEIKLAQKYVNHGDHILDVGGCIGVTAAVCARLSGNEVSVVEPNLSLHETIRRQVALNSGRVEIDGRCVAADARKDAIFFVHRQPWRSALYEYPNGGMEYAKTNVPVVTLNEVLMRYSPDVTLVDVEGSEVGLFKDPLFHKPRCFIVEIHDFYIGETAVDEVITDLVAQDYRLIEQSGWTRVFVKQD